ncbi:MAG TPA: hypothetical protein VM554_06375 [Acidisarcina sp.]|nr:hypothetical protein [Acidisarcina sp.]
MQRSLTVCLLLLGAVQGISACAQAMEQVEAGQFDFAGKTLPYKIRRLPLSAFPELPAPVRYALEERHCLVPQTFQAHRPENVIHGDFWQRGSLDWAVLCSHGGTSSLLVFRGNALGLPIELENAKDVDRLQVSLKGTLGFAWGLDVAEPQLVQRVAGSQSASYDHDGIQVSIVDRYLEIRYNQNGTWLQIEGAE